MCIICGIYCSILNFPENFPRVLQKVNGDIMLHEIFTAFTILNKKFCSSSINNDFLYFIDMPWILTVS